MDQEALGLVAESLDTIYDISEGAEDSDATDISDDRSESSDQSEPAEAKEGQKLSRAESEIEKMMREVGADTLLQIIKDNRNAAIRQIISEVEASRDSSLPSGSKATSSCTSIFDLAALAG
ncbi:MAG: hypothetical protein K2G77_05350 [Muribaculaceae bacterium]|nr:hypothetical protein [Muribaculaceae bacterium]